jgi:hypothetical protein
MFYSIFIVSPKLESRTDWIGTMDNEEDAIRESDYVQLGEEQFVMVIPTVHFREGEALPPKEELEKFNADYEKREQEFPRANIPVNHTEEFPFTFWIRNGDTGEWFLFGECTDVEHGRYMWTQIASIHGADLIEFEIREEGNPIYTGNFSTDEC